MKGGFEMVGTEELFQLEEIVRDQLKDSLETILIKLNRTGQLDLFLSLIGLSSLEENKTTGIKSTDRILVIGQSSVPVKQLRGIIAEFGFTKEQFDFKLEYEDAKGYDFAQLRYSPKYTCVLVGPMPHSCKSKGNYSSVIGALENTDGYPPVYRIGNTGLKITKSAFRACLSEFTNYGKTA